MHASDIYWLIKTLGTHSEMDLDTETISTFTFFIDSTACIFRLNESEMPGSAKKSYSLFSRFL